MCGLGQQGDWARGVAVGHNRDFSLSKRGLFPQARFHLSGTACAGPAIISPYSGTPTRFRLLLKTDSSLLLTAAGMGLLAMSAGAQRSRKAFRPSASLAPEARGCLPCHWHLDAPLVRRPATVPTSSTTTPRTVSTGPVRSTRTVRSGLTRSAPGAWSLRGQQGVLPRERLRHRLRHPQPSAPSPWT